MTSGVLRILIVVGGTVAVGVFWLAILVGVPMLVTLYLCRQVRLVPWRAHTERSKRSHTDADVPPVEIDEGA